MEELKNDFTVQYEKFSLEHLENCDCSSYDISLENVLDATFSMKKGKSADEDGISAEHFFNAPLSLFDRLQNLVNIMLRHSFVPKQFCLGFLHFVGEHQNSNLVEIQSHLRLQRPKRTKTAAADQKRTKILTKVPLGSADISP